MDIYLLAYHIVALPHRMWKASKLTTVSLTARNSVCSLPLNSLVVFDDGDLQHKPLVIDTKGSVEEVCWNGDVCSR